MAEDREAFRDLLDRIDQPYAPSFIVEGATDEARHASAEEALTAIGLPAIIRPAFTLGGTGGGIVETEDAYWERVRAGLRASPIKQVMIERCLVGWQEIEYEVMRDARGHVHRRVLDGERRPAGRAHRRLDRRRAGPDAHRPGPPAAAQRGPGDHPGAGRRGRLQRPVRAVARLDRVRGDRGQPPRVAVVGARVEGDRLPDRAGRGPDRRGPLAGRDPQRRHGHDRRGVRARAGLRRRQAAAVPVRQVPRGGPAPRVADEGDRRGDGHRPHLRGGAQQGAPRPRAGGRGAAGRGRRLAPDVRLPHRGLRVAGRGGERPARSHGRGHGHPLDRRARRGVRELRGSRSAPPRRSCSSSSSSRRTRGCGGCSACSAAACPRRSIRAATGISPWFLAEMGRNIRLEHDVRAAGATW